MIRFHWKFHRFPLLVYNNLSLRLRKCCYTAKSLTYNHFMNANYAADVFMEPLFWFVDNFTYAIGPFFVVAVVILTTSVVFIAYWLGLPYWMNRSPVLCVLLVIIGNWLLVNVSFHYYMAVTTHPGFPPQGELITEAVSICKKCIAPKPPRTHHCSVCNRCILKMDHHCPWLNNCVGYRNHRYFFLYMVYMVAGVIFLVIFGAEFAYEEIWSTQYLLDDPELEGHPIKFNKSGSLIIIPEAFNPSTNGPVNDGREVGDNTNLMAIWRRRAVIYIALLSCGVLVALGSLAVWHGKLIGRGETSIEANINKAETTRLAAMGRLYFNPYNFGSRKNWRMFLGLVKGRSWWRYVLLPSSHAPIGDGLIWHTINDDEHMDEWP